MFSFVFLSSSSFYSCYSDVTVALLFGCRDPHFLMLTFEPEGWWVYKKNEAASLGQVETQQEGFGCWTSRTLPSSTLGGIFVSSQECFCFQVQLSCTSVQLLLCSQSMSWFLGSGLCWWWSSSLCRSCFALQLLLASPGPWGPSSSCSSSSGSSSVGPGTCTLRVVCTSVMCRLSAGSYQVYSIYPPNYQKNETNLSSTLQKSFTAETLLNSTAFREGGRFCNRSLYLLAFWSTTLLYVLAGSTLLGMLCMCACMKGVEVFVQHLHSWTFWTGFQRSRGFRPNCCFT